MYSPSSKSILVVLTNTSVVSSSCSPSHSSSSSSGSSGGNKCYSTTSSTKDKIESGFDIKEVAYIYLNLSKKLKYSITFATPCGGVAPVDPNSRQEAEKDSYVREFLYDTNLQDLFRDTKSLKSIRAEDFSIVLVPGKHAAMMDLSSNDTLRHILDTVYFKNNGIIATIGHGTAALLCSQSEVEHTKPTGFGKDFLKNRKCTGPTNNEEKNLNVEKCLPYLIEDRLRECGANFVSSDPFKPFVVVDDRLITGQNSKSISNWLDNIIDLISRVK